MYIHMHVSDGTNGKAGLNFGQLQKSSKVSISVTLFQVLKDLPKFRPAWACLVNTTMCFDFFGTHWQKSRI